MRLKPEKIERLARAIYESLAKNKDVTLDPEKEKVVGLIIKMITDDMKEEQDIEREARERLDEHAGEIQRSGVSYDKVLQKAVQKVAQERKFHL